MRLWALIQHYNYKTASSVRLTSTAHKTWSLLSEAFLPTKVRAWGGGSTTCNAQQVQERCNGLIMSLWPFRPLHWFKCEKPTSLQQSLGYFRPNHHVPTHWWVAKTPSEVRACGSWSWGSSKDLAACQTLHLGWPASIAPALQHYCLTSNVGTCSCVTTNMTLIHCDSLFFFNTWWLIL